MKNLVTICVLLLQTASVAESATAQLFRRYWHKSEPEIARMTPAQRVEEWVNEQVYHRFDLDDDHADVIKRYVLRDGLAALPRIIEIMDEYDPTRFREGRGRRGERFDACWLMLGYIDDFALRLRGSEEGRRAMAALERAIARMRATGYGQPDQHEWEQHGRFEGAEAVLMRARGINITTDQAIRNALRLEYRLQMSDEELLAFSNFLVARDSTYPHWSEVDYVQDPTRINATGVPVRLHKMGNPQRFYEAYLEFRQSRGETPSSLN